MNKLLSFAVFAALVAFAAADCKVSVTQTLGSAWTTNGQDFSQWSVTITNTGSEGVKSVDLSITDSAFDQLWNIVKDNRGLYVLPDYILQNGGIAVSGSYQFGYIIKSKNQATIDLEAVDCKGVSPSVAPSASPAAPSASASPAAPSASPSSSAAPSIVATPQPAGCAVTVQSVARSAASGGQWTEGDSQFQIYDLTITASGNTPVDNVKINIAVQSGVTIYQFWNLQRQAADSNIFSVPTPWGPIQVGASQGAGYIIKYKTSAAAPVVTVESTTCNGSPTAAPSSAPASPSSAPASPSPSTVVSTPQPSAAPSGCSAEIKLVARSAASGGQWQDANGYNQIFDVTVTNIGTRPINGGQVSFTLASGVSITQFWELNRKDATTFAIPTTYGPIQVGASQGAGIVGSSTSSATIAVPTATLTGLTCN